MKIDYDLLVREAIKSLDCFYGHDTNSKYIYGSAVLTDKGNVYPQHCLKLLSLDSRYITQIMLG